ncbi:MAG: neutral/alkaline non-lysosomal ceramidase N-terminal domain-containing protein [Aureliella sp.]
MLRIVKLNQTHVVAAILLVIGLGSINCAAKAFADDKVPVFQAGAATSNITPPLGEMIVGGWQPIPATNIHDELHARCLVLDDGKVKLGIVLCDNVGIPAEVFDHAKQLVNQSTGFPITHLLMASTHTHSATTARGDLKTSAAAELTEFQHFVARRISDGVRRALANLAPAKIGWGKVEEPSELFNRRWHVTDNSLLVNPFGGVDQVRMNPPRGSAKLVRPAGPTDPEVSFIAVQHLDGRPMALLANYSLHYVGGVRPGDVSADYFGYFAKFMKRKLDASDQSPPFVGILSNGTSGDVNNIDFTQKSPRKYERYEKMQEVAEKVASRVYEAYKDIEFRDWVPLSAKHATLTLKTRQPTEGMLKHFAAVRASNDNDPNRRQTREELYADRIAKIQEAPEEVSIQLQALRIGDLGIAAIPFETFTETGLELKNRSPLPDTFTIELANGSFGYLPTPRQHRLGGYETWLGTNYVEKQASTKIVAKLLEMFESLTQDAAK